MHLGVLGKRDRTLLPGGHQSGKLSVGGIDHKRSPSGLHDRSSPIPPSVVISKGEVRGCVTAAPVRIEILDQPFFVYSRFLFREERFSREFRGPLQWRNCPVVPDSLQIRLPVGGARWSPSLFGRGSLSGCGLDSHYC
jgi:hypothetical protein